jgi:hypothetical protein
MLRQTTLAGDEESCDAAVASCGWLSSDGGRGKIWTFGAS